MARPKIEAKKRKILGRKIKALRREGILPANLYGRKVKSQALEMSLKNFQTVYSEVGETGLIDLVVDKETRPVLIHNLQRHPVTDEPLHADLHQVDLSEKTTATVSIELTGESPAVEQKIGILIQPLSELEIEALPADLVDHLLVDISSLKEINDAVTVADISVDKSKIEIKVAPEEVVAKIEPLVQEEEVVSPPPAEGEKVSEGEEAVAEGGEKAPEEAGESPRQEEKVERGKKKE